MSAPAAARRYGALTDLLALSAGEIVSRLAGFVAFAYLARALAPEAYGAVELAVSLALLFGFVVDLGIGQIGAREIARDPERTRALAAEIPAARLLVALAAIPAMGATAIALGQPPETVRLVWVFALGLLAAPWRQQWLLQGLEMMPWVSGASALRAIVFALAVVPLVAAPDALLAVGVAELASALAVGLYFVVIQQRRIGTLRLSFARGALVRLWRDGLPLGLAQLVWSATQYLPTLLVAGLVGGTAIAWFGAAHRIMMSLWAFSWIYHFNLFPALTRGLTRSDAAFHALLRASLKLCAWAGVGVALVVTLLAEPLCALAFGAPFVAAAPALALGVWVVPGALLSGHARSLLIARGLQRHVLQAQLLGGATMLGGGFALVPWVGAPGAAAAMTLASVAVLAALQVFAVRRVAPLPLARELARPALCAAAAALAVRGAGLAPGWDGLAGGLAFTAAAFALDRGLPAALRTLAEAKAAPAGDAP
jgi:O-antigen/teichoic acid export membrane protein